MEPVQRLPEVGAEAAQLLSRIQPGCRVRLVAITGGHQLRSRLVTMGLLPGAELEVVKNNGDGPVILSIRGSRLVLGRGMSQQIMVL